MTFIQVIVFLILIGVFVSTPVNAQVTNGHFTSSLSGWTHTEYGWMDRSSIGPCPSAICPLEQDWYGRTQYNNATIGNFYVYMSQDIDVTGYSRIEFGAKAGAYPSENTGGTVKAYLGGNEIDLDQGYAQRTTWYNYSIPVSGTGTQTFKTELYCWKDAAGPSGSALGVIAIDHVILIENPVLSGYVHDNYGYPIGPAYLSLNESVYSTESNDSGYYEITNIVPGTYLLTITSGNNYDYTATIDITSDTEHNVTVTRLPPAVISGPSIIDSSVSSLRIGWTENSVTDSVKIYKSTNTNLIYTMDTAYTYINSYIATGLGIETSYTFWIQPMDGTVSGLKYEISGTTGVADTFIPLPITTPTPVFEPPTDNETTIINDLIEIITEILPEPLKELPEKVLELIEETIIYVSTPFNWLLLITAYIGAFISKSIFDEDEDYAEIITNTLLFGTIGWIVVLLINFFIPIISQNEILAILIFTTSGFIIASIASSIQPETKTRAPRRPH